nr:Fic family protein [uncultured Chitinophaga sp.]
MKLPEPTPLIPNDFDFNKIIQELHNGDHFQEFLDIESEKYYYFNKWKYKAQEWNLDPRQLWGAVKAHRIISNKRLNIGNAREMNFQVGSPSVVQKHLHEFDLNLGGSLQGDSIIPSQDKDRYLISSLMEEAIASSQLEGATTTRKIAKDMLEKNRKPQNHAELMIFNNYHAMKWIVENKHEPITVAYIKQLHTILTRHTLHDANEEGEFRNDDEVKVVDVQTGVAVHIPPKAADLQVLMKEFCNFANDKEKPSFFLHPIVKGIILHFLVGYIHPFADGNGRTARTIFYWYLLKHGYWLIEYMSVSRKILASKAQYSKAYLYTERDNNDLTYFIIYNLKCINLALEDLKHYIRRKSAEKQNAITMLRATNLNDRQIILIQEVIQDPTLYFTVKHIENKFGVSNQTARTDLNGLVADGFFEERRVGNRIQYLPIKGFTQKIFDNKL